MMVVRNQRILAAGGRHDDDARRAAEGLPPRTRKPRRELASAGPAPIASPATPSHGSRRSVTSSPRGSAAH